MAYSFDSHLQPNEYILWQGEPNAAAYAAPKTLRDLLIALPVITLFVFFEFHRRTLKPGSPIWWALLLGGAAFTAKTMYENAKGEAWSTSYALTNRRVLVRHVVTLPTRDVRVKVDTISLARLNPKLLAPFQGVRTIVFGTSGFDYAIAFRAISDAEIVYQQLVDARATISPLPEEIPYYTAKSTPRQPPVFDIQERLRDDEAVLWQGQPQARGYVRLRLPAEFTSLVFLIGLFGGMFLSYIHMFTWQLWIEALAAISILSLPLTIRALKTAAVSRMYVVTNQRVVILTRDLSGNTKLDDRELRETRAMKFIKGSSGTATIEIEKRRRFIWHGMGGTVVTTEFSLKSIENASDVFAVIEGARRQREEAAQSRIVRKPPVH